MKRVPLLLLALCALAVLVPVFMAAAHADKRAAALHCARTGSGTDQSIADCYTSRGLPCPADICPTNQE